MCFNIFQISFDISKFWYTEISSNVSYLIIGLGLWCLMPLSITFQLYCGGQFYWWRKPKYPEKTPTCHKLLTNFITQCCIEYIPPLFELSTLVVIGSECIGSCIQLYKLTTF